MNYKKELVLIKVNEYLKHVRKEKGLTLKTVGDKCGVSKSYLSQLETGSYPPAADILRKLSNVLNVPYLILLEKADQISKKDVEEYLKTNKEVYHCKSHSKSFL